MKRSVTFVELLVAISLVGILIAGISSLYIFAHFSVSTLDPQTQVQNEASYILEHMAKEINKAIGDANNFPAVATDGAGEKWRSFYIDYDTDGQRSAGDRWVGYHWDSTSCSISYCAQCIDSTCASCNVSSQTLSTKITSFNSTLNSTINNVVIQLTTCQDTDGLPYACGTANNPQVNMLTRVMMPSVSVR